jgi:hypothetical protein
MPMIHQAFSAWRDQYRNRMEVFEFFLALRQWGEATREMQEMGAAA